MIDDLRHANRATSWRHALPWLSEDERIKMIGEAVASGKLVGILLDDDEAKVQRYITKIEARYPTVGLLDRREGPVSGVVTLRFSPKRGPKVN